MSLIGRLAAHGRGALARLRDADGLSHFRYANADLAADPEHCPRIVFMGDSILAGWPGLELISPDGWRTVNRAIPGQKSGQMLRRFDTDVMALQPSAVFILAGTNDVRADRGRPGGVADRALEGLSRNLRAMTSAAQAAGAAVILGALPPVNPFPGARPSAARRDASLIRSVNAWLHACAEEAACGLVDFHGALADPEGALARALTDDGVHPNAGGYAAMAAVLKPALADTLTRA